jgi:hypothetical protein
MTRPPDPDVGLSRRADSKQRVEEVRTGSCASARAFSHHVGLQLMFVRLSPRIEFVE